MKIIKKWKFILSFLLIIIFNEYILFECCYLKWLFNDYPKLNEDSYVHNVLLIADPQLIGFEYEYQLFGPIVRWDADRFLKSGFSRALKYTNPKLVVFLGDIFDEGEIATSSHFNNYLERFKSIFIQLMSNKTNVLVIPGDNDIGGEDFSSRDPMIVERFLRNFNLSFPYIKPIGNINFIASDIRTRADFKNVIEYVRTHANRSKINVLLNHESVDMEQKIFTYNSDIQLAITAHIHLSKYKFREDNRRIKNIWSKSLNLETYRKIIFRLSETSSRVLEITVPTCSYRMGVPYPGYGFLKISDDGKVQYRVLWLPYRFYCLAFYLSYFIISIVFYKISNKF